jgi:hypothetical protein
MNIVHLVPSPAPAADLPAFENNLRSSIVKADELAPVAFPQIWERLRTHLRRICLVTIPTTFSCKQSRP